MVEMEEFVDNPTTVDEKGAATIADAHASIIKEEEAELEAKAEQDKAVGPNVARVQK